MQEKISFEIRGKIYETLPLKVGNLIDFYKQKAYLAGGTYQLMYSDTAGTPERVLDMINCNAFMQVFCPKFLQDIKPNKIEDLGLKDYMEILEVFRTVIKPYLTEWREFLTEKE